MWFESTSSAPTQTAICFQPQFGDKILAETSQYRNSQRRHIVLGGHPPRSDDYCQPAVSVQLATLDWALTEIVDPRHVLAMKGSVN